MFFFCEFKITYHMYVFIQEEDNDWSEGEKSRSGSVKSSQSSGSKTSATKMSTAQSKDSLFTEEPDDSLFSSMPKPKAHR